MNAYAELREGISHNVLSVFGVGGLGILLSYRFDGVVGRFIIIILIFFFFFHFHFYPGWLSLAGWARV